MARPVLQVKGYSIDQIKALIRRDERYTIGLRLYAVLQVAQGQSSRKLEQLYNTSFKQITNWVHRFEKGGLEGLRDLPRSGRKTRLTQQQRERIKHLILQEQPSAYGFNTATWTGPLLIEWIKTQFGVEYKKAQIYNILKSLGLSHQKGKGHFPEIDPGQRDAFKERLKKTARRKPG